MRTLLAFLLLASSHLIAAQCASSGCNATIGLRKVGSSYYCGKHYCAKHKALKQDGKCEQCDLASQIARGKGKCTYCANNSKLVIAENESYRAYATGFGYYDKKSYSAYCPDHYCAKHKKPFRRNAYGSNSLYCSDCLSEKKNELIKQKAETLEKLETAIKTIRARTLDSLFGIPLGASPDGIVKTEPGKDTYRFTPKKQFRNFTTYTLTVVGNQIGNICASQRDLYLADAEAEFGRVVSVLDSKYSAERRSEIYENGYNSKSCTYNFGCTDGEDPKQIISVRYGRMPGTAGSYEIKINAYVVEALREIVREAQDSDEKAL